MLGNRELIEYEVNNSFKRICNCKAPRRMMWCLSITPSANETSQKGNNAGKAVTAAKEDEERTIDPFNRIDCKSKSQLEWISIAAMFLLLLFIATLHSNFSNIFFIYSRKSDGIFQLRNISFKIFHLHSVCHDFLCSCEFLSLPNQYCYVWFTYTFARKINFSLLSWDVRMGTLNKQFLFYHISFRFVLIFCLFYVPQLFRLLLWKAQNTVKTLMLTATASAAALDNFCFFFFFPIVLLVLHVSHMVMYSRDGFGCFTFYKIQNKQQQNEKKIWNKTTTITATMFV